MVSLQLPLVNALLIEVCMLTVRGTQLSNIYADLFWRAPMCSVQLRESRTELSKLVPFRNQCSCNCSSVIGSLCREGSTACLSGYAIVARGFDGVSMQEKFRVFHSH
jgi:hypothetical protein